MDKWKHGNYEALTVTELQKMNNVLSEMNSTLLEINRNLSTQRSQDLSLNSSLEFRNVKSPSTSLTSSLSESDDNAEFDLLPSFTTTGCINKCKSVSTMTDAGLEKLTLPELCENNSFQQDSHVQ